MDDRILILGASTRAAAQSAVRAGLRPICADLFADQDLREIAEVLPITGRYPQALPEVARLAPDCPWMFTGALENHPEILERISAERPLWGNPADVVRRVRDPIRVSDALSRSGLPTASIRTADDPPDPDGNWLLKPLRGAAGRGIVVWDRQARIARTLGEPHYFQERLRGSSISAVYVAFPDRTMLAGISRQLTGDGVRGAAPFRYAGSLGPVASNDAVSRQIEQTGRIVADRFGLRGLFGCDFVEDGKQARLTEVNPRYTASVEIHEYALEVSLIDLHRRACESFPGLHGKGNQTEALQCRERWIVGKHILYAERDLNVPSLDEFVRVDDASRVPSLADIPAPGTLVTAGHPICTVLASGPSVRLCEESLAARVQAVRRALYAGDRA